MGFAETRGGDDRFSAHDAILRVSFRAGLRKDENVGNSMTMQKVAKSPLRSALGLATIGWACVVGPLGTGCARGRTPPPRPVTHEATVSAAPASIPAPSPHDSSFSPLLKPVSDSRCPPAFPHGYQFVGTTESEARQLFKIIWLDGISRGDYVVPTGPESTNASVARCFAVGPHRDLNISNWCCR
jgi:hypothetical protein